MQRFDPGCGCCGSTPAGGCCSCTLLNSPDQWDLNVSGMSGSYICFGFGTVDCSSLNRSYRVTRISGTICEYYMDATVYSGGSGIDLTIYAWLQPLLLGGECLMYGGISFYPSAAPACGGGLCGTVAIASWDCNGANTLTVTDGLCSGTFCTRPLTISVTPV